MPRPADITLRLVVAVFLWFSAILIYVWWSYGLVDPNLTLVSHATFVNWQARRLDALTRPSEMALHYAFIICSLWIGYLSFLSFSRHSTNKANARYIVIGLAGTVALLMLSHSALSRDIYNYLFNAKMIAVYNANPHVQTALEFRQDEWTRFMHNTHTPAPYGYLWTASSLIPFVLSGAGKIFMASYLAMRLWMVVGWLSVVAVIWKYLERFKEARLWRWALFAFHPLILVEVISNGHNDVWMMLPAVTAWGIVSTPRRKWHWLAVGTLTGVSIWFKFATLTIVPILGALFLSEVIPVASKKWKYLQTRCHDVLMLYGADLMAVAMTLPLLTSRSQQFHTWYAVWFLTWLPFTKVSWVRWALLGLSFTSQLRYMPWILAGLHYPAGVFEQSRMITWSGLFLGIGIWALAKAILKRR